MDSDINDTGRVTRLQQLDLDEQQARRDRELTLAAEANHRLRVLNGDWSQLGDLAGEWIELLRVSNRKSAD